MKALLIIDMQKGGFVYDTPRYAASDVIHKINVLASHFRRYGHKVIFIQHDGTKENAFIPNTSDWEIIDQLSVEPDDIIISKTANDPFYRSNLEQILRELAIEGLTITGWATDFCVDAAVHSALSKDFT